jgi:hypothetical protein
VLDEVVVLLVGLAATIVVVAAGAIQTPALLKGLIFGADGRALSPTRFVRSTSAATAAAVFRAAWTAGCDAIRLFGFGRRQPSSSASYRARYRRSLRIRRSCDVPRSIGGVSESARTATTEATVAPTATPTHPLST